MKPATFVGRAHAQRPSPVVRSVQARSAADVKSDTTELGKSGLQVCSVGVGAWSWGDRSYWGYGTAYGDAENFAAYQEMVAAGLTFIDTAEVYGFGKSEALIGDFMRRTSTEAVVASKFAPLPWRFSSTSVTEACKASLSRMGRDKMGLYMIHWPGFLTNGWANEAFVDGLSEVQAAGLADAVGVSNFNATRLRSAHKQLLKRGGTGVAANQVQYSLLYRTPETNGVLDTCREEGITLTAYSPLAQGLLTGKYKAGSQERPTGPRAQIFTDEKLRKVEPLVALMREIGQGRGGKTPAQIAINWCICKGALPLPGAKSADQAASIAGALGWRLTSEEVTALDGASQKLGTVSLGAPFENW